MALDLALVSEFFLKLEGPYKWYVLALVIIVITGLVTRFIFKTLKWFIIILAIIFIILALFKLLTSLL